MVYDAYTLVEILLISLYFNYTIDIFKRYGIGVMIGIFSVVAGIFIYVLQSLTGIDSYFMAYTSVAAICMSIVSVFRISISKDSHPTIKAMPHFWFSIINLVYWSATFTIWILLEYYRNIQATSGQLIFSMLTIINILGNTAFGLVFLYYPKMIRHGR